MNDDPEIQPPVEADDERAHPEEYLADERDILDVVLARAKQNTKLTAVVQIGVDPKPEDIGTEEDTRFWFEVRKLEEVEDDDCRKAATTYKRRRRMGGMNLPEEMAVAEYRSRCVIAATTRFLKPVAFDATGEPVGLNGSKKTADKFVDAEILWKSKTLRTRLEVENNWEIVDKLMIPGEKDRAIEKIEELSGFNLDLVGEAKN